MIKLENYARSFSEFLKSPKLNPYNVGFNAIQKGERVLFQLGDILCEINFDYDKKNNIKMNLEMKLGDLEKKVELISNIQLSKKNKISGNTYPIKKQPINKIYKKGFLKSFEEIKKYAKDFYQELNCK